MHVFLNRTLAEAYAKCNGLMLSSEQENSTDATINYDSNVSWEPVKILSK
nr:MAG TPA: hypothetical protein [Caudoviricetes sp.]